MNSLYEKVSVEEVYVCDEAPIDLVWEEDEGEQDYEPELCHCGAELDRYCDGDLHCPDCEGPCDRCYSGDGPGDGPSFADDDDDEMFDFDL